MNIDNYGIGCEELDNNKMKQSAIIHARNEIPVFPIWPSAKNPINNDGFKGATTDIDVINGWWTKHPCANIGMPTGRLTGIMVVDVDFNNNKNGEASLCELEMKHGKLPETRKHRTPSGGYHLLFEINNQEVPSSQSKIGDGIDIRADGGYVLIPPSVYNNKQYDVMNHETPIAVAPGWLTTLACKKKDTVVKNGMADDIVSKGHRNDYIFRCALNYKYDGVKKEDALHNVITENDKCNPPLSENEVTKTVNSAYRYESEVPQQVIDMNKTHAAIKVGGNCYVLEEVTCPTFNRPEFELLTTKGFKDYYCNQYIEIDGKKKKLGEAWFSHPMRRQYNGLVFNPKSTPEGYYNIWKGFAVKPKEGDCSLYLKHIEENIANGDRSVNDYIIGWMAQVVQHPDELIGVAIVMRGSMGVGKGVFVEQLGKLFGRHYMLLNDSNQLVGKFNGHMKDKCLLFADEAFWAGDKAAEGKLKSMITEPTITIEMKGKDAYTVKNNLHMIFATNNEWAAPAGPSERRFFVIDVGDKHKQDHAYFRAIVEQMENGGSEALLFYLQHYDISETDLRKFPKTTALRESKLLSATPAQKYWHHVLETGCLHDSIADGWGDGIVRSDYLYNGYIKFVQDIGVKHKSSNNELGIQLKTMLPANILKKERRTFKEYNRTDRINCYCFPSLKECRDAFDKFMNTKFYWLDE